MWWGKPPRTISALVLYSWIGVGLSSPKLLPHRAPHGLGRCGDTHKSPAAVLEFTPMDERDASLCLRVTGRKNADCKGFTDAVS